MTEEEHQADGQRPGRYVIRGRGRPAGDNTDAATGSAAVIICVAADASSHTDLVQAKEMANRLFGQIGVTLMWRGNPRGCPVDAILINVRSDTPPGVFPQALAAAMPFEGAHIRVFFDRIHQRSFGRPALEPVLLAHVLVHEIVHILQGTDGHSNSGLMKALWDRADCDTMMRTGLAFTREDII
jgi:hypothetical protein